ncbi:MAG: hypothetical protein QOI48_3487 [Solirubrobacteraceae bacterium]|nr:hypothetical protein [Solirubrobacteraceae bacterium]
MHILVVGEDLATAEDAIDVCVMRLVPARPWLYSEFHAER